MQWLKKLRDLQTKIGERISSPLHSSFKVVHTGYFGCYAIYTHEMVIAGICSVLFAYCVADLFFHFLGD